jgi:pimeloyl-ACP methyl ester carboxylesterase
MKTLVLFLSLIAAALIPAPAAAQGRDAAPPDVQPIGITCEECPYPYPSKYFDITTYGQDVRMAYMDVAPQGQPNGHTVVLLHGNNFAGFYYGNIADALSRAGFRVIVPDQMGYGRSSKPIIPYSLNDFARYTHDLLQSLNVPKVMVVGHSMGGMLATRFATQYPQTTERLVLYNPIGLSDSRLSRRSSATSSTPIRWSTTGNTYRRPRSCSAAPRTFCPARPRSSSSG